MQANALEALADMVGELNGDEERTEYPGVGHNSWDLAYGEPELMGWLLATKR